MFFSCYFNAICTIFALSFVQVICSTRMFPRPNRVLDDITSFRANTYCKFQANRFKCGRSQRNQFKYYYDAEKVTCRPFDHGNCFHPYNVFSSLHACRSECKDMNLIRTRMNMTGNVFCRLQPEFGRCNSYHPRWYFDISEMRCRGFSFSGCGGNQNNFETTHRCLDVCASAVRQCKPPTTDDPKEILSCYT